jgi:hypothetical protein
MIRETLSSDIELAQRMLKFRHSDGEIVALLTSRGIEPALVELGREAASRSTETIKHKLPPPPGK